MRTGLKSCLALALLALSPRPLSRQLWAQNAPASSPSASLQEQLEAQYPTARLTSDGGCAVANPETGLVLRQGGIGALPQKLSSMTCAAHYRDGHITKAGFKCNYWLSMTKQTLVALQKGDTVFPMKIEVEKGDVKIAFGYCSGDPGQASAYTGAVVIEFPKDSLKTASVTQVEDKIAEVFQPGEAQDAAAPGAQNQPPASTPNGAQEPQSIEQGQTIEQVEKALGPPTQKFKAGGKQIYVYKDVKITFVDGKVSAVE